MNTAVCLFGSVARGKADKFSDKDLLVVSDQLSEIPDSVKESWKNEGWSPAYYTWPTLIRKAVKGDLFIQHLKQEGVIIDDPSGNLAQLLSDFSPRPDYSDEIAKSIIMLRVADRIPENDWLTQMECEVTSRFFRYAVLNALASRQQYVFDYNQSIDAFSETIHNLEDTDKALLRDIRGVQNNYHIRQASDLDTRAIISHMKSLITQIFGFEFLEIPATADARSLKAYSTVRDIEARMLAYHDPLELDKGKLLPDIWKLVQDPKKQNWAKNGSVDKNTLASINDAITNSEMSKSP